MASSTPADDQLAASEIVFTVPRLPRGRRARLALGGAVGSSVVAVILELLAPGDWAVTVAFGATAVGSAVLDLRRRRFRTRLSAQGVEVRGYVDRFIPWSEVTGIEVGGYPMPAAGPAPIRGDALGFAGHAAAGHGADGAASRPQCAAAGTAGHVPAARPGV